MTAHQPPPLADICVLEFAGLAPGPFAGMLLADYGATVLRLDRAPAAPTSDQLTRRKTSICVNLKSPAGLALIKKLIPKVDVIIDPFRPGVLEKAGLDPETVLLKLNPRLIVARMTGFRRDGKYSKMAGHDINYIAVSGVLSMFGRKGEKPYPPGNVVGDFAGGGAMCVLGILLALLARERSGFGQVVEANMVDGSAILATMPRLGTKTAVWKGERGTNMLDGGAPFYDTYETKDGGYMAVGAIEPQFWAALLRGMGLKAEDLPGSREDKADWPRLKEFFASEFRKRTRGEWEEVFDGTDACCTPVFTQADLESQGFDQRPAVTLKSSPGYAIHEGDYEREVAVGQGIGWEGGGWSEKGLEPGNGGEETLSIWMGWTKGRQYVEQDGGLVWKDTAKL
ncbi:Alpha-methylacyl-CoA racemase [Pyrenophora tritici-repentis]|uniref:CaiB, acyl-CoA transferase-carnitine dehydratase n=1 Tax=Pyrenophora tritici-repentis TaxID=45151 RepID=A0A2W1G923_9PLEO|nr:Alpha-methylacyl-CoA racemase [Pyrenophora tritici-repentis]KAF7568552.1 CaiB, acyl-CoA transferase-carnitine dehydratase [Pyrenophora tritici-repentis]PZD33530.1 CaiB, acyl-CoA transferasecarnitine dehydratase [Pyrenophora tritici-repentis]